MQHDTETRTHDHRKHKSHNLFKKKDHSSPLKSTEKTSEHTEGSLKDHKEHHHRSKLTRKVSKTAKKFFGKHAKRPEDGDGAGTRSGGDCTLADPAEAVDESMENPDPESDRNPTSPTRLQYRVIDGSKRESPRDLKVRPHTWVGSDAEFTQKKEDSVSNALPKLRKITIPRPLSSFTPTGATSPLERAAPATKRYTYTPFVSITEQTSGAARASATATPPQKRSTLLALYREEGVSAAPSPLPVVAVSAAAAPPPPAAAAAAAAATAVGGRVEATGEDVEGPSVPRVTAVSPAEGPSTGGTFLTIRGGHLGSDVNDIEEILVCGADCTASLQYESASLIYVVTSPWKPCVGKIKVTTKSGGEGVSSADFNFSASGATVDSSRGRPDGGGGTHTNQLNPLRGSSISSSSLGSDFEFVVHRRKRSTPSNESMNGSRSESDLVVNEADEKQADDKQPAAAAADDNDDDDKRRPRRKTWHLFNRHKRSQSDLCRQADKPSWSDDKKETPTGATTKKGKMPALFRQFSASLPGSSSDLVGMNKCRTRKRSETGFSNAPCVRSLVLDGHKKSLPRHASTQTSIDYMPETETKHLLEKIQELERENAVLKEWMDKLVMRVMDECPEHLAVK